MTLPFSDALFCQAFPRECTESFQEGHRRAFEFFGGVPKRITYDNSKIAVSKDHPEAGRRIHRASSCGWKAIISLRIISAWSVGRCEKGHTETLVGYSRRNFMVPIPEFDDFEVFNEYLGGIVPAGSRSGSCGARPTSRRSFWKTTAGPCCRCRPIPLKRGAWSLAKRVRCRWSASTATTTRCRPQYAHQAVMAIGGIEKVRFVVRDHVVAEHPRDWEKENVHYDPVHYLALLERKPGALDFGKPFDDWDLPEVFGVLRRRLEGELGQAGRREFIKVLRLLESCELKELARAVDRALQIGALTVEVVRLLLQDGREEPAKYFRLDGRPHLQGHEVPPPNLAVYNTLRQEDYCHVNNENTLTRGDLP